MPGGLCLLHSLAQADTAGEEKAIPGLSKKRELRHLDNTSNFSTSIFYRILKQVTATLSRPQLMFIVGKDSE